MKHLLLLLLAPAVALAAPASDFRDHLGIQLWSLRAQTKESTTGALDLVKGTYGITEVETAGTGSLTVAQFNTQLHARGLIAVSGHFGYDALKKDISAIIADAKALGLKYVICPSLGSAGKGGFDVAAAQKLAVDFNAFGEACRAAGMRFGYHPHGSEFVPTGAAGGETSFDVLMRSTNPSLVCYEMDVFWVVHAGQDPVALLKKYPGRWTLMHVKDMRKGTVTGHTNGHAAPTDNVAIGTGQIDYVAVLRAAREVGVQHYFIEDETPAPLQCIPASLAWLRALKL